MRLYDLTRLYSQPLLLLLQGLFVRFARLPLLRILFFEEQLDARRDQGDSREICQAHRHQIKRHGDFAGERIIDHRNLRISLREVRQEGQIRFGVAASGNRVSVNPPLSTASKPYVTR